MQPIIYKALQHHLAAQDPCALATVTSGPAPLGAELLITPDGKTVGDLGDLALNAAVTHAALELMRREASENRTYGGVEVLIDVHMPQPRLVIFGGVHTAIPLTQMAQLLGFRVILVDGRARFASRERFPTADEIIVAWPEEALSTIRVDSSTYVAILTHDPKFDIPALAALAKTSPRYIGSMGSRETRQQHFAELRARGVPEEFLASVHGPIGLDLGARSPEEMALAIMAEIIAVRYGRSGRSLSYRWEQEV